MNQSLHGSTSVGGEGLPAPARDLRPLPLVRRVLTHPRAMHYNRLVVMVLSINVLVAAFVLGGRWRLADGGALSAMADLVLVNLAVAVLARQQDVLNLAFAAVASIPRSWPYGLRRTASKLYHYGGVHVGAAVSGVVWMLAFTVTATVAWRSAGAVPGPVLLLAWALTALLAGIAVCALPPMRVRHHDLFEASHRFGGWTAVVLFWPLTWQPRLSEGGLAGALGSWQVWLLAAVTVAVVLPWLRLRRVPVTVEHASSHAVVLYLDYGITPIVGATIAVSRHPLRDWHSFATVRTPGQSGYRLLVSRAGNWTGGFIDDPPTHVWVKGRPVASLLSMEVLYGRLLYVATGSGIGPMLGPILAGRVPSRLVWSVRSPRATYGDELVDAIETAQPGALVWDTTQRGTPDLLGLTLAAAAEDGAEAVVVVSNKPGTRSIVRGVERLGISAIGPVFDS